MSLIACEMRVRDFFADVAAPEGLEPGEAGRFGSA
jgi:hypothetical protein